MDTKYKPKYFKVGDNCPLCNGFLIDINKGGLLANKIVLKCNNEQCDFNKIVSSGRVNPKIL